MTDRTRTSGANGARSRHATRRVLAIAIASLAALAALAKPPTLPRLVWNASASTPRGLYGLSPTGDIHAGNVVAARVPAAAAGLAERRGYLPVGVPLVKTVAAVGGDRVCGSDNRVLVNDLVVALRRRKDGAGHALPAWTGCRTLSDGQVLLLGLNDPASFDGRYFGPSPTADILGEARLLWAD